MPIYEYRCNDCRRTVSVFFRSVAVAASPRCPHCDGTNLERRFSRVSVRRGGSRPESDDVGLEDVGGDYGDGAWDDDPYGMGTMPDLDDADPRDIARWTRSMSAQMGEPLEPDLDRALTDIERGADPEEVLDRLDESMPPDSGDIDAGGSGED